MFSVMVLIFFGSKWDYFGYIFCDDCWVGWVVFFMKFGFSVDDGLWVVLGCLKLY